jgi:hypothetical protein
MRMQKKGPMHVLPRCRLSKAITSAPMRMQNSNMEMRCVRCSSSLPKWARKRPQAGTVDAEIGSCACNLAYSLSYSIHPPHRPTMFIVLRMELFRPTKSVVFHFLQTTFDACFIKLFYKNSKINIFIIKNI